MGDTPATQAVEAVILDMDGLLIDTEPVWRDVERELFGELGIQLSEADMLATMGRRALEMVAHWRRQRPWPGAETGEPSDQVLAERVIDRMVAHVSSRGEPMPGVVQAIELIRRLGLRVAIASSSPHRLIDAVCARLRLEWIEVRCSASDEQRGKPAGDVYLTAARRLGLRPAACLAIEDSPNGVLSARAAGMRCVAVPDRHLAGDPRYREADLVLGSLRELDEEVLRTLGV
ncbi:MAG: hexitol phosphatase HxpB [Candidatus Dormibacteria bacterium]|jgi:sugar-phosphatase|nr:hexitol phosphatase HxpB [Chloroflexota bacterium]